MITFLTNIYYSQNLNQMRLITLITLCTFSVSTFAQDYWPMKMGNKWQYNVYLEGQVYDYNLEIVNQFTKSSIEYFEYSAGITGLFTDSAFYYNNPGNQNDVLYTSDTVGGSVDIQMIHYVSNDTLVIYDTDSLTITYHGSINTPAGQFTNVYKVVNSKDKIYAEFYAPGVGLVKSEIEGDTHFELKSYNFDPLVSTKEVKSNIGFYPNPVINEISFSEKSTGLVTLYASDGKKVFEGNNIKSISMTNCIKGVYYLHYNGKVESVLKI